ncbi:hypothetical protein [Fuerstiella marisgermanici]|uniref:DUF998 domain-containing protein n=1 Tax=Fuerstiella marisgermanici TaxID=1891926 RepID=A0A1P8WAA1_9PLAN|nr:hypothetical protein [Fuerstiella marisgermanici]APZ90980.1 hypothetical protein Fuma_00564 [Fuerstiella marisgermanici]
MKIPDLPQKTHSLVLSYIGIRRAIGMSGLLLPVVLGPGGWLLGIEFQDNMSSYYHTGLRDVFVGTLCGIGIFLFCYRGQDRLEDWTANIGCISALGIALCPLDPNSDPLVQKTIAGYLHSVSGGVFFLTLAVYSLFHFPRPGTAEEDETPHVAERNFIYRTSGIVILLSMMAMGAYLLLLPKAWKHWLNEYNFLFWGEWIVLWAFAAAWLTKGRTIVADVAVDLLALSHEMLVKRK